MENCSEAFFPLFSPTRPEKKNRPRRKRWNFRSISSELHLTEFWSWLKTRKCFESWQGAAASAQKIIKTFFQRSMRHQMGGNEVSRKWASEASEQHAKERKVFQLEWKSSNSVRIFQPFQTLNLLHLNPKHRELRLNVIKTYWIWVVSFESSQYQTWVGILISKRRAVWKPWTNFCRSCWSKRYIVFLEEGKIRCCLIKNSCHIVNFRQRSRYRYSIVKWAPREESGRLSRLRWYLNFQVTAVGCIQNTL